MPNEPLYDCLVAGNGPAGAAAAMVLARAGRKVVVIGGNAGPGNHPTIGWTSPALAELMIQLGFGEEALPDRPLAPVRFFSADLEKSIAPSRGAGFLVNRPQFQGGLLRAAAAAGATLFDDNPIVRLQITEDRIHAALQDETSVAARLLILACGSRSDLGQKAPAPPLVAGSGRWTAFVEVASAGKPAGECEMIFVLGLGEGAGFATVIMDGHQAAVAVHWAGEKEDVHGQLRLVCDRLSAAGLLPPNASSAVGAAPLIHCPSGAALEMHGHVAKLSLVVGDAGGFVALATDEGIYPGMWSAKIAAETVLKALQQPHPQNVLMEFETQWRSTMAEYLRGPNMDLQFLLPLVFSNPHMADKLAGAFFLGESF